MVHFTYFKLCLTAVQTLKRADVSENPYVTHERSQIHEVVSEDELHRQEFSLLLV